MVVFWDVMLCTLLDHISSILKMSAVFSFEMFITTQLSTEICPTVKLYAFIVVVVVVVVVVPPPLITDLKICFAISPKLSEEQAYLDRRHLWLTGL